MINKNQNGIKSINTNDKVDKKMKIKSEMTSNFAPVFEEIWNFLANLPSEKSEIAVKIKINTKYI